MKVKYDAKADRMRLAVGRENLPDSVFWLKRNQCLALLVRLCELAAQLGVEAVASEMLNSPPRSPQRSTSIDDVAPEHLDAIRVRLDGDRLRLALVHAQQGVTLNLTSSATQRLQEMLLTQAERAGWDPVAGIERLKAMAEARAAIDRSKDSES